MILEPQLKATKPAYSNQTVHLTFTAKSKTLCGTDCSMLGFHYVSILELEQEIKMTCFTFILNSK